MINENNRIAAMSPVVGTWSLSQNGLSKTGTVGALVRDFVRVISASNQVRRCIESGMYGRRDTMLFLDEMISYRGIINTQTKKIRIYVPSIDARLSFVQGFTEESTNDDDED